MHYIASDYMETLYIYADKILVRNYVAETIGVEYLPQLYQTSNTFDEIDFSALPDRFYLKANHGCGYNIAVMSKSRLDVLHVRQLMTSWLAENYYDFARERQYRRIRRRILAEEMLDLNSPKAMLFSAFMFGGHVGFIRATRGKIDGSIVSNNFYSDWQETPFYFGNSQFRGEIERPEGLAHMLNLAQKLAAPFPFVRVDLYWTGSQVYFGELTFTPSAGDKKFVPQEYDFMYGEAFPDIWP